jgi:23S rRNA (pseudouridine1915-N3)-methyltransferase
MQLLLLTVGRLRPALREVCDDYVRRLHHFVTVTEVEVREAGRGTTPAAQQATEGERLLARLTPRHDVVLLDTHGTPWSSERLATALQQWRIDARDRALVIGGAAGVSAAVRTRADDAWSLGPMTLPHELARVIVVEQLYRASTILLGHPYHRGAR